MEEIIKELNNKREIITNAQEDIRNLLQLYLIKYCPFKIGSEVKYDNQKGIIQRLDPVFLNEKIYISGSWVKLKKDGNPYMNASFFTYIEFGKMTLVSTNKP